MSKRDDRTKLLLSEFQFYEIEEIAHLIATEIPWRMVMRIINKMRRIREAIEITEQNDLMGDNDEV